jgi:predicted acyltransferase
MLVSVPGYGAGILEPLGSLAWYIDANLLSGHTWSGAPAPGFDPEGILSTLGAIATTLCGIVAGQWIRSANSIEVKTVWMFVAGNFLLLLGAILDIWMPINKNLWTSSYVVFMAGFALTCLAMFYWLIDAKGYTKWAQPFVHYGMNAIAVFVLSGVVGRCMGLIKFAKADGSAISMKNWIFENVFVPLFPTAVQASTAFAVAFIFVMYLVVWAMWKKKIFIKV